MKATSNSKNNLPEFWTLFSILALSLFIASCGGGSSENTPPADTTPTISSMTALSAASGVTGIIAAPTTQTLTIYGTNFVSGTTVTIANNSTSYPATATTVPSSTEITTHVTIPSVPTDSYVTVTLQPPTGSPVSGILGVAHAYKTISADIQSIFDKNLCNACHGMSGGLNLSNAVASSTGLIETMSIGCTQKFRVKAGDPRRANNVLIDVVKAKAAPATHAALSCNDNITRQMPQGSYPALSAADIEAIVDWIALGTM